MTIYNLNGSEYILEGPNPLMKKQEHFKDFVLHNFNWKPEVKEKISIVVPKKSDFHVKEDPPELPESKIVEKIESHDPPSIDSNITRIHCLPVKIEQKIDELYGETRLVSTWGNPFLFEAIILDQNDFMINFWTNIEIESDSIIYPVNRDKRWWKVNNKQKKRGRVFT